VVEEVGRNAALQGETGGEKKSGSGINASCDYCPVRNPSQIAGEREITDKKRR